MVKDAAPTDIAQVRGEMAAAASAAESKARFLERKELFMWQRERQRQTPHHPSLKRCSDPRCTKNNCQSLAQKCTCFSCNNRRREMHKKTAAAAAVAAVPRTGPPVGGLSKAAAKNARRRQRRAAEQKAAAAAAAAVKELFLYQRVQVYQGVQV